MEQRLLDKLYYYKARVARVVDADTLDAVIDLGFGLSLTGSRKKPPRLRLARVDAWETRGEEREKGLVASEAVLDLMNIHGMDVVIHTIEKDNFGRWLAEVWLADGTNLGDFLLREGHAELYGG